MKYVYFLVLVAVIGLGGCGEHSSTRVNATANPASDSKSEALYQCPMHPHFTSSVADTLCPVCGMSLVAVDATARESRPDDAVSVSPEMIQSMGVRTVAARVAELGRTLRAFGTVETDERQENVIVSRLEGWIDRLQPRAEGDTVRPGALLYRVYSPDLISAQKDYLNSLTIGNDKRIAAVRQRLVSLGMQEAAVRRLVTEQKVLERVPVYAEAGGIVAQLDVSEGDYVKPGSPVMRLQSYSSVWIIARIPEQDLALVTTGLEALLNFPSAPGAPISGAIDYIYPTIDAKTRTGNVRIEIDNEQGFLRPGAYADITFDLTGQSRLSIPTEAILRDSRGSHVILALGNGRFSSRQIETGLNADGLTEVTSGLEAGEVIVSSGQFLLDSEVNLREGLAKFGRDNSGNGESNTTDPHADHNH